MHEDIIFFSDKVDTEPFSILMCGRSFCDGSYRINRPKSSFYCIEYICKGCGYVRVDDVHFQAAAGDIYILPAGKDHFYYSDPDDPWEKLWFNISGSFVENTLRAYELENVFHVRSLDVQQLFESFLHHAAGIQNARERFDFNDCAVDLLRIVQRISCAPEQQEKSTLVNKVRYVKDRIDTLTDFSVSFDALTDNYFYTRSHLIRAFKAEYGVTPYEYLLQRKLSTAKLLLKNTAMSITQIAHQLGFADHHYFSSFFTKRTGISPRKYRQQ